MTLRARPIVGALLVCACLSLPQPATARAVALSQITFDEFAITPASGTISFLEQWGLQALSQADNSFGQFDSQLDSAEGPGRADSAAAVIFAEGSASARDVAPSPPFDDVAGSARARAEIPNPVTAQARSLGRATFSNTFEISGGTGPVDVTFEVLISPLLDVFTDRFGQLAEAEWVFTIEVDGVSVFAEPVTDLLRIGPNDADTRGEERLLTATVPLAFDTDYFLLIEADAEAQVINIPEPTPGSLLMAGLVCLVASRLARVARAE